ncbi:hypothetical protein NEUTE1DRAFT_55102 [Neurospora tetrasperma FGSC 2508]|uniref:Uncharacterized protein n=1 Tax=Neurospora tetrasperma (strain FGSC 2508 / ATCC MYA-4615 / P0657) TaxID=510951 RepID=F8MZT0_NEUT8|nr:uncharacterized protein NEUTE1DRAFT_55102 [Neurospora tetrasperma FGSC 2508]EGO52067.1 hypothetical protein NEUTE1DRAFT_55102 [Neurospora tetrasperma FGSC 2508]
MEVKKDGVFVCVTTSSQEIRKHLRDIAKIKLKRTQEKTEEVLREKGIYDGPEEMVEDVYKEIIDGSSNYPVYQQAELLVEAGRIGVLEAQMANPHYVSKEAATLWPRWGNMSPYLRFIELRERLAKEGSRPVNHAEPVDIEKLSTNQLSNLHEGCKRWMKSYKENGESHSLEVKRLFDRAKELAKEAHDMRTAIKYFSRMKLDFMVDKLFMMEIVVTHFRSFKEKVATMEWCLERCEFEERVRAHGEQKKKNNPECTQELEDFMVQLKWTGEDIYLEEFSDEKVSGKKLTDELPWSGALGAWMEEGASHAFDEDDSNMSLHGSDLTTEKEHKENGGEKEEGTI